MLDISARVESDAAGPPDQAVRVTLVTNGREHPLGTEPKPDGRGLATNGGELLCLALATCFCNDVYREAAGRGIVVRRVAVEVRSRFGAPGQPAQVISYRASVAAEAPEAEIRALLAHTDRMAEIQNTLRRGMPVILEATEVETIRPGGVAAGA